jgi:hypothetical protein
MDGIDDEVRRAILGQLSVPPEVAGRAYLLGRNASYKAVQTGKIKANKIGGKWSCPTAPIRRDLGLDQTEAA